VLLAASGCYVVAALLASMWQKRLWYHNLAKGIVPVGAWKLLIG